MKNVMVGSKMFIKLLKMWVNMLSTSIQKRFCKTYWKRNDFWIDVGRQNVPPKETAKATKHRSKFVFLCDMRRSSERVQGHHFSRLSDPFGVLLEGIS